MARAAEQTLDASPGGRAWFGTVLRLWLLRRVGAPRGRPGYTTFFLCASWVLLWVAIDYWQRGPSPRFAAEGVPLLGWYGLALLMLAALLRRVSRPTPAFGDTLALSAGLVPFPLLLTGVVAYYLEPLWYWCLGIGMGVASFAYLSRGLRAVSGARQRAAALLGVLFLGGFLWLSDSLNAVPDVWNPLDADAGQTSETATARADDEALLFEQAGRIDDALEAVQRGGTPAPQGFFLGFAGVGAEKVFAQEIGLASRVLGERYGMQGRELSLINDERDVEQAPIASVSGLRYALRGLAMRMQVDRDVLFLAISSHGSQAPAVAVENADLPLAELTDDALAQALHDSGIQWRVVVISACYAGGFIEALRDPRTIVIAAAAADRTSFGCSSDADLTYFGEAFYRDALPTAHSLREAFATAKAAVAARERREGETPSDPQAYFGAELEAKLAGMGAGEVNAHMAAARAARVAYTGGPPRR